MNVVEVDGIKSECVRLSLPRTLANVGDGRGINATISSELLGCSANVPAEFPISERSRSTGA